MNYKVPFVDPREHYRRLKPEIDAAIVGCLSQGDLISRRQLAEFEAHLAQFVGTRFAVGVNSGYHALALSLLAAGIGPGDEVITVAHTFVATVSAIIHAGARPVLVDVGPDHNMDPEALARAVTPKTRAVLPVHLNGRVCDMRRISTVAERHGLLVIEDAAQALGARFGGKRAGSFGKAGCFSFYPFKMLGGFGDGGAVTTDDPDIARKVTLLRFNGEDRATGEYHAHGYTALLDNVQAAVLDVKLGRLPEWIDHRRAIALRYRDGLARVKEVRLPPFPGGDYEDSFQNFVIRAPRRDELRSFLRGQGVETLVSWPKPMWRHDGLKLGEWSLPETEALCREVLSLPMSAETTLDHVDFTTRCLREFFETSAGRAGS